jgi:2-oxoglutarate dehydrogenase E2 component (dihydrolipoamide succinyltransferase)
VPSPVDGVVTDLLHAVGDTVEGQQLLAKIDQVEAGKTADIDDSGTGKDSSAASSNTRAQASPAVRKMMTENNIGAEAIQGSGKNGRITKVDVQAFIDERTTRPEKAPRQPPAESSVRPEMTPTVPSSGARSERREPMSRLRATIARRLKEAQNTQAMLTTFNDVNLQAVMDLRKQYREDFEKRHGARLGMMSFFVKASVDALKQYPAVNASIDGDDLVFHEYYDVGFAASSPRGLVVPVLRDVDAMSFSDIEKTISDYGGRAKDGGIKLEELTGGTFTITNGGVFGSMLSTPIINPPQSAILGMHRIEERPVAENGEVVIRPMMYLALTYDHRIIDGAEAVRFLARIKECLEEPARMLIEI